MKQAEPDAIGRWIASAIRYVELPSGTSLRIRLSSAEQALRRGVMPRELRDVALRFATSGVDLATLDPDGMERFLSMKNVLLAEMIREIYIGERPPGEGREHDADGWRPVSLTAADLMEADIDPADVAALESIMLRQKTPAQITAASRLDRKLISAIEADAIEEAEKGRTAPGMAEFRGDGRGTRSREDGGTVRAPAGGARGDRRSRARDRVR